MEGETSTVPANGTTGKSSSAEQPPGQVVEAEPVDGVEGVVVATRDAQHGFVVGVSGLHWTIPDGRSAPGNVPIAAVYPGPTPVPMNGSTEAAGPDGGAAGQDDDAPTGAAAAGRAATARPTAAATHTARRARAGPCRAGGRTARGGTGMGTGAGRIGGLAPAQGYRRPDPPRVTAGTGGVGHRSVHRPHCRDAGHTAGTPATLPGRRPGRRGPTRPEHRDSPPVDWAGDPDPAPGAAGGCPAPAPPEPG